MMILYTFSFWMTGIMKWFVDRKARGLEGRYMTSARAAEKLAHELNRRPGNSNTQDPYVAAKGYYELGKLVDLRDQLETRHVTWQGRADRVGGVRSRMKNWKGRYVPYLAGVVDLALVVGTLYLTGVVDLSSIQKVTEVAQVPLID